MHDTFAFLFNPVAGKGKALRLLPEITARCDSLGLDYRIILTERPGHAEILAREAASNGFSVVVAAGGDGTCNEVINGLIQCNAVDGAVPPIFGVLPVGRGNDFSYGAGIPADIGEACRTLAEGVVAPLDIGRVTGGFFPDGRYFGNGIGIGFDTIVGLRAAQKRYLHGALCYVAGAVETLCLYPSAPQIEIEFNGERKFIESQQISILNGRRMGGVFFMAPDGDNADGLLDLCMVTRPMTRRDMIALIVRYTKGTQGESPLIEMARAPSFSITAPQGGLVCHADGETVCTDGTALEVGCVPSALRILRHPSLPEPLK